MRNRFWVVLITCLFATFSVLPFAAISEEECDEGVCAGAWITGNTKLKAKTRVFSPTSLKGRWTYRVKVSAGEQTQEKKGQQIYMRGVNLRWDVSAYTDTAFAYAGNVGKSRHSDSGKFYSAYAKETRPDDD